MILKIKGHLEETQVGCFSEASDLYAKVRDESGEGCSTFPEGQLAGQQDYRVSYNAKVWTGDYNEAVYDPYA